MLGPCVWEAESSSVVSLGMTLPTQPVPSQGPKCVCNWNVEADMGGGGNNAHNQFHLSLLLILGVEEIFKFPLPFPWAFSPYLSFQIPGQFNFFHFPSTPGCRPTGKRWLKKNSGEETLANGWWVFEVWMGYWGKWGERMKAIYLVAWRHRKGRKILPFLPPAAPLPGSPFPTRARNLE